MQTPAYPNLTDIKSTIKGTMEELLKKKLKYTDFICHEYG